MKRVRIVVAGGGTGGHLFPALAIAEEIKKINSDAEIIFVGTRNKIEARVVPQKRYQFRTIWISGWSRRLKLESLVFPVKVMVSLIQSYKLLKNIKPDVVVGTGGYVCGPILRTAVFLRIPTLIQEQNSYPGVTTRLLANKVNQVHVSFDETKKYLKRKDNIFISGNPTREELTLVSKDEAFKKFGFDPDRPVALVFGGSLGAAAINDAVLHSLSIFQKHNAQIIWSAGENMLDAVKEKVGDRKDYYVVPFIDDMASAYAAATLAVCRAGATTIAELTRIGVPSILIPYPYAAADHQVYNARTLAVKGAAYMILNKNVKYELPNVLDDLLSSPGKLETMRKQTAQLGNPEAGKIIAEAVLKLTNRKIT